MANKEFWIRVIEYANKDEEIKELLADLLNEFDRAKALINESGFSWTGLSMLESVKGLVDGYNETLATI